MADRLAQLAGYRNELQIARTRNQAARERAINAEIARLEAELGIETELAVVPGPPERATRRKAA